MNILKERFFNSLLNRKAYILGFRYNLKIFQTHYMRGARPQVGYKNSNDQATIFYDRRRNWRSFSLKTRQYRHSEGRWDRSHGWACCLYNTVESVKRQQWKKNLYCKNIHYSCQLGCGVFTTNLLKKCYAIQSAAEIYAYTTQ